MEFLPFVVALLLSVITSTSTSATLVYDTSDQPLRRGQTYYILPSPTSTPTPTAGGLTLAHRSGSTLCPPYVTQSTSPASPGLPLTFSPADPNSRLIALSADLNIAFAAATICVQSTAWRLGELEGGSGRRYVSIGGVMGRPGLGTAVSSWFRIDKYSNNSNDYKLVFCPGVCKECRVACGDLGVYEEEGGGKRWVGISDVPLPVVFKKTT